MCSPAFSLVFDLVLVLRKMPAYHSAFNDQTFQQLGNTSLLPLKKQQKSAGPAPIFDGPDDDVIDEAINLFRANCFFRNFEVKGPGDRVLIYLTIFISECLGKLAVKSVNVKEASVLLYNHAVGSFSVPGEASFPLNSIFAVPQNRNDQGMQDFNAEILFVNICSNFASRWLPD